MIDYEKNVIALTKEFYRGEMTVEAFARKAFIDGAKVMLDEALQIAEGQAGKVATETIDRWATSRILRALREKKHEIEGTKCAQPGCLKLRGHRGKHE